MVMEAFVADVQRWDSVEALYEFFERSGLYPHEVDWAATFVLLDERCTTSAAARRALRGLAQLGEHIVRGEVSMFADPYRPEHRSLLLVAGECVAEPSPEVRAVVPLLVLEVCDLGPDEAADAAAVVRH